jgi:hypothetical protein
LNLPLPEHSLLLETLGTRALILLKNHFSVTFVNQLSYRTTQSKDDKNSLGLLVCSYPTNDPGAQSVEHHIQSSSRRHRHHEK